MSKLKMEDLFTDMRVKHVCYMHPDYQLYIDTNNDGSFTLFAMLVSDRIFKVTDGSVEELIALFNSKWTLDYTKKW